MPYISPHIVHDMLQKLNKLRLNLTKFSVQLQCYFASSIYAYFLKRRKQMLKHLFTTGWYFKNSRSTHGFTASILGIHAFMPFTSAANEGVSADDQNLRGAHYRAWMVALWKHRRWRLFLRLITQSGGKPAMCETSSLFWSYLLPNL